MAGILLPGMPGEEPAAAFVMPMMRGFGCDVASPMINGAKGNKPPSGLGVGASNVPGKGTMFFVSIHGDDDDTLVAQLDYARYRRLCELMAALGKQQLLVGFEPEPGAGDAFGACEAAHPAIASALLAYGEGRVMTQDEAQACADAFNALAAALGVVEDDNGR
jgi:hypothetical protein